MLTGSGRAFCVGQDLKEHIRLQQSDDDSLWETVPKHYNPIVELLTTMNKPVVAALNGVAAGAGAAFAIAADFRVMVDTAGFNLAFAGIALSCDSGSSWSLTRLVGPAAPRSCCSCPAPSLPTSACPSAWSPGSSRPTSSTTAVHELATRLASGPTLAYGSIRQAVAFAPGTG